MTQSPASILIVRLSAIGDIIHTLPMLDVIHDQLPDARIGWLVEELGAPLLANHPYIDRVYTIPKKRWRGNYHKRFWSEIRPFFRAIHDDGWDAAIDCQGITKSGLAAWLSGATVRVGYAGENSREANSIFMNRRIRPHKDDRHVVQQSVRLVKGLGLHLPKVVPAGHIRFTDEEVESIRQRIHDAGWRDEPLLIINPAAGFPSKLWEAEKYAVLGARIAREKGLRPLVLWGPGEEILRDRVMAGLGGLDAISAPPTSIRESSCLVTLASLFLGGDTGPSQIAGMLGIPVLTVFGATDGDRNRPWGGSDATTSFHVQRDDLWCLPCRKRRCPIKGEGRMACLHDLMPDDVYSKAEKWLAHVLA